MREQIVHSEKAESLSIVKCEVKNPCSCGLKEPTILLQNRRPFYGAFWKPFLLQFNVFWSVGIRTVLLQQFSRDVNGSNPLGRNRSGKSPSPYLGRSRLV